MTKISKGFQKLEKAPPALESGALAEFSIFYQNFPLSKGKSW
jgi:hypothetical protein